MQWQDIESGPREAMPQNGRGPFVWLWFAIWPDQVFIGWWRRDQWEWEEWDGPGDVQPDKWMPIDVRPEPPKK